MTSRWFIWFPIAAVVILALLAGGSCALYRAGWESGYAAAKAVATDEQADPPHPWGGPPYACRPFGIGGLLLGVFLFLMALGAMCHVFRLLAWRKVDAGGPGGVHTPWMRRWYWRHSPAHPRHWAHWGCEFASPDEEGSAAQGPPAGEEQGS
jgi:hypothetical protein